MYDSGLCSSKHCLVQDPGEGKKTPKGMQQQAITHYLQKNMPQDPKENTCTANTLDPERLLAWGNSQLEKIEKKRKKKKSNSEDESYSKLTRKTKLSCTERKQTKVFQEDSEEEQRIIKTQRLRDNSKSSDRDCDSKLEMKENKDINTIKKKKKKKKAECDVVSVNIDLKKGDISYETNFSKSNKKKGKKKKGESSDKKHKKKDCISESNNINNEGSYVMSIKLTKLDDSHTTKESDDLKSKKKKKKKKSIYPSVDEHQEGTEKMGENELSPSKKKKKSKKDTNKESGTSKAENNLEISYPSESSPKSKKKKKKSKDSYCTEHMEKIILSNVNITENEININKDISIYTKKEKSKKRMVSSENGDSDSPPVHKKKKKKHKEKSDNSELNMFPDIEENVNEDLLLKKKKKKSDNDSEGGTVGMDKIYFKKKQKKKIEKNTESLYDGSAFSVSSKSEKSEKVGMKFGKSPISRLLSNQELCNSCSGVNTCSRKLCKNNSDNSADTETDASTNNEEVNTAQNSIVIKQEKIDTEVENRWPSNITIKQEKNDDPQLDNSRDASWEMTTLNQNVQIKQEVCDTPTGYNSNNGENTENVPMADLINHTSETGNGHHDINSILISSNKSNTEINRNINNENVFLKENQDRQKYWESEDQYYVDSCETYYNFCDNKLVIHEEIGVCNEVQNQNGDLSDINTVMNNKEVLQEETSHDVNYEADRSHPNQNADTTNTIVNSEEVSKEEICHNGGLIKLENNNISHNPISNSKDDTQNSMTLDYIPLSDMEECNQAYTSPSIRIVNQEHNKLHVTVHQHLNKFELGQDCQRLAMGECHQLQSDQYCQNPVENDCNKQQTKLIHKQRKKSSQSCQKSHESRYFENHQSSLLRKSLLFSCVRPQFKKKEQVSRLLKIDITQVEFCYYRMSSKFYQDVHVKFFHENQFEKVIRHYANRIRCKSWHIRNSSRRKEEKVQKKRK